MGFFADLHIHSKYSRATSPDMNIPSIARAAKVKGIKLMGTGDFTHPKWLMELKNTLEPVEGGLFIHNDTYFILTGEVSNIFERNGVSKKVHNVIFVPDFITAEEINKLLSNYGNLDSDGRPMLNYECDKMVRDLLKINPDIFIVPAHIWTPWFSLFGANSGFNKIEDCFGDETDNIYALETGLSSDPPMNWLLSALDRFTLISNSDAHSVKNIGREVNYFECALTYWDIIDAMKNKKSGKLKYTVEFFPEEGKYHYDGHRKCGVRVSPKEAEATNGICPKCGKPLTRGVLHRVYDLKDRDEGFVPPDAIPCKHLIPLREIIAFVRTKDKSSVAVDNEYMQMIKKFGSEFDILIRVPPSELAKHDEVIAQAIENVRKGEVEIEPGYDGVYGEIRVKLSPKIEKKQMSLF